MKTSPGDACRSNAMRRRVYCAIVSIHGIKHDSAKARKPVQLPGEERRMCSLLMDEDEGVKRSRWANDPVIVAPRPSIGAKSNNNACCTVFFTTNSPVTYRLRTAVIVKKSGC